MQLAADFISRRADHWRISAVVSTNPQTPHDRIMGAMMG
jgi:hypothetical protein